MAHRHLLYRAILVLLIIVLAVNCLYLSLLHKLPAPNPSVVTKSNQQPTLSNIAAMEIQLSALNITLNGTQLQHFTDSDNTSNCTPTPNEATKNFGYCTMPPPTLKGLQNVTLQAPQSLEMISRLHPDLDIGGHYKPSSCNSKDKVAIIIPYRDRAEHLRTFMYNIHPMLKRQMLEYSIFVIEQLGLEPFNRAMLFNVGFVEASNTGDYDCFIFHDVDLIPENDRNLYNCPAQPRHMSVAVDRYNYKLPFPKLFGGVSALRTEHFKLVNGFSNVYWGWGMEDDDMWNRIAYHGLNVSRRSSEVSRYTSLTHKPQKKNDNRFNLLQTGIKRFNVDGLFNLNYAVEEIMWGRLFTLVRVKLMRLGSTW